MNKILAGLLTALLCSASLGALAQAPGACQGDVRQFCGKAGNGAVDCLLDHQQDISDACYDSLKQQLKASPPNSTAPGAGPAGGRPANGAQACKSDAEKLCQGVQPGGGRIVRCLMDHQQELSDACYDTLASRKKKS
jgi:hypothetical protein